MVKITKKITAIVLAGILMAGSVGGTPTLVEAKTTKTSSTKKVDWSKKYPKLKNPKKKDIKKVAYSKATNAKINRIIKKLDQLEKKFSMKQLKLIWKDIFDLNIQMPHADRELWVGEGDTQLEYIVYKATYYSFIHTKGKAREKFFTQLVDDITLSAAKRLNSGKKSDLFLKYGTYYWHDLSDYFHSEKISKLFAIFYTYLSDISNRQIYPPYYIENDEDYDYKYDETDLPSKAKPDEDDSWITYKPEYVPLPTPPKKKQTNEQETKDKDKTTGLSFEKYCKEAVKLGFQKVKVIDISGEEIEGYEYKLNGISIGNLHVKNEFYGKSLQLNIKSEHLTNPSYKKWRNVLQKSFNLLLPTQGKELFNIVSQKDIKDKLMTMPYNLMWLTMDGREIVIKPMPVTSVFIEENGQKTNKEEIEISIEFR